MSELMNEPPKAEIKNKREQPYVIMLDSIEDIGYKLNINVEENVKKYETLGYTTDINTMSLIVNNQTIRSTCLSSAKLNDLMENKRNGITQFAGSRFITCFTHMNHECIPFWTCYGGNKKERKVQLLFKNFASKIEEMIFLDYAMNDCKKVFFASDEYNRTIQQNGVAGALWDMPAINTEYSTINCIKNIDIFDVDYVSPDSDIFTKDYSGECNIEFSNIISNSTNDMYAKVKRFEPSCLGRQKSEPWSYEKETRLMLILKFPEFNIWKYIDLRLNPEFFRNLIVITSPWIDKKTKLEIESIIRNSSLPQDIKDSIHIRESVVEGTLNFDTGDSGNKTDRYYKEKCYRMKRICRYQTNNIKDFYKLRRKRCNLKHRWR